MEHNPFTSEIGKRVLLAFARDTAHWRSLGGIARESGRTTREVAEFIENNEHCFVQSSIKFGGSTLHGIRKELREQVLRETSGNRLDRATG